MLKNVCFNAVKRFLRWFVFFAQTKVRFYRMKICNNNSVHFFFSKDQQLHHCWPARAGQHNKIVRKLGRIGTRLGVLWNMNSNCFCFSENTNIYCISYYLGIHVMMVWLKKIDIKLLILILIRMELLNKKLNGKLINGILLILDAKIMGLGKHRIWIVDVSIFFKNYFWSNLSSDLGTRAYLR